MQRAARLVLARSVGVIADALSPKILRAMRVRLMKAQVALHKVCGGHRGGGGEYNAVRRTRWQPRE